MYKAAPTVLIIGGGATGTGIAREAARRGYTVVLIERGNLGEGTSGRFHGILHSGARYAVNDPAVAATCYSENQRLRQMVPSAITDTGGMFVALNDKEAEHAAVIMNACKAAGIPVTPLSVQDARDAEPHLSSHLTAAFRVPDGYVDGAELMRLNKEAALAAATPATFMTRHTVVGFTIDGGRIVAATAKDTDSGTVTEVRCDYVINAAGVWAGQIAHLAGAAIEMVFDKGTMIVFKEQYCTSVLNRCRPEDDGDLLVPHAGQSIMGTTARIITDPDDYLPTQEETDVLVAEGAAMVPALRTAEAIYIYAGVRPLIHGPGIQQDTRAISRSFQIIDHAPEGVSNFMSIVGGKVTLFQLMAESAVTALDSNVV